MADVQKHFEEFDREIRLGRFDEEETLREKRDRIRDRLKEKLPEVFESYDEEVPDFYFEDQGSYEMGTAIEAIHGDIDIDQGLYVHVSTDEYDPVVLKERVYEALGGYGDNPHTQEMKIRRPCVTVWYQRNGEHIYHVDLAVYSDGDENADGKDRLAMGREHSNEERRYWEVSDPQALKEKIFGEYDEAGRAQFRRVVRYLKRWKDLKFSPDGNEAPLGIGLTVAAHRWHSTCFSDVFSRDPDDLEALRNLVGAMLRNFRGSPPRLEVNLPVEPYNDLFEEMTDRHQEKLQEQLEDLKGALDNASQSADPHDACETLRDQFGDDFPVPSKEDVSEEQDKPWASSSSAAAVLIGGFLLLFSEPLERLLRWTGRAVERKLRELSRCTTLREWGQALATPLLIGVSAIIVFQLISEG
jgi:hypothetical protein